MSEQRQISKSHTIDQSVTPPIRLSSGKLCTHRRMESGAEEIVEQLSEPEWEEYCALLVARRDEPQTQLTGKIVFDISDRGFRMRASYDGALNVEVTRGGRPFQLFHFEAYRIWNLKAHFSDWVDEWLWEEAQAWREVDKVLKPGVA